MFVYEGLVGTARTRRTRRERTKTKTKTSSGRMGQRMSRVSLLHEVIKSRMPGRRGSMNVT